MKTFSTTYYAKSFLTVVLFVLFSASLVKAEDNRGFNEKEVTNLIIGIKSDNEGLMRSSVYFAGKYKLQEAVDALLEAIEETDEPANIILIAFSLYEIGDEEAMMKLLDTAGNSSDRKVKKMLTLIPAEYFKENSDFVFNITE